jgi:drug/metabolite transporter (DMT)-like permease
MIAFAGNSLLCRLALKSTGIDPASFTSIRIISGALVLWLITRIRGQAAWNAGSWQSASALFVYATGFSLAYVSLPIATGTLLLFGAVQVTMIEYGLWTGERLGAPRYTGLICALGGLVGLLLPGLTAPPLPGSVLMLGAGIAWGVYSLRSKGIGDPTTATAGNFLRAVPMAVALSLIALPWHSLNSFGVGYAIASGALASGAGYAIWYTALRGLKTTSAATIQLSVPVITAVGGIIFLGETITLRFLIASAAILFGIALVPVSRRTNP